MCLQEGFYFLSCFEGEDAQDLAYFLRDRYRLSYARVVRIITQLARRTLFGCYLLRDPNNHFVGHVTLDLSEKNPSVFASCDLKKRGGLLIMHLWFWIKMIFVKMAQADVQIRGTPIQEAHLCIDISAHDPIRKRILEAEGFSETNSLDWPALDTLYWLNHSTIRNPIRYQVPIKEIIKLPIELSRHTLERWRALITPN